MPITKSQYFANIILNRLPDAVAVLHGAPNGNASPEGTVSFYRTPYGTLVTAALRGLPVTDDSCRQPILALHIHEGHACTGSIPDPFANSGSHYNPGNCLHPYHAGDLPPLFAGKDGSAWSAVLSDRFSVDEVMGRTVILHSKPDDFTSQPSGNAGDKVACGLISPVRRNNAR